MKILKTKKYSILSNILRYSLVIVFTVMLVSPVFFVVAEGPGVVGNGGGPGVVGDGTKITNTIKNPLGDNGPDTIPAFIEKMLEIVMVIGVPIVVLFIIYTGFLFVEARGNPEKLTKAKKALIYTLIGAALLLGAFVIANAIGKTVEEIKSST